MTSDDSPAFVDVETTGIRPDLHEIYEVGLILPDGTERQWFLPITVNRADPIALSIGKFHDRHPQGNARVQPHADGTVTLTLRQP